MNSTIDYQEFIKIFDFPPTHEQEQVIRSTAPAILVLAGAGAGKTATMSQRIAWHIASGMVTPQQVLGLTFTKKAAGELSERVDAYVRKAQRKLSDLKTTGTSEQNQIHANQETSDAVARNAEFSQQVANHIHQEFERPTISTYNSFASEIAMSYAMLIGEDPRARLITEGERWQIMQTIVANWGIDQNNLGDFEWAESSVVDTALSMAAAIIDNKCTLDEVRSFFLSEAQAIEDIDGGMRLTSKPFKGTEASKGFTDLKKAIVPLKLRAAIVDIVKEYFEYKKAHSLIEYADQVAWATRILTKVPQIGQELRAKYKLILLDEYQDTSINQAEFIAAAFQGADSVCAVGDPNQAIYGWRGASANALADFSEKFAVKAENTLSLSVAFRNSQNILKVANIVTSGFEKLDSKVIDTDIDDSGFERPWRTKPAVARASSALQLQQLQAAPTAPAGAVIHIHKHLRQDSYRAIARQIAEIFSNQSKNESSRKTASTGLSAAVLIRKHKYAQDVIAALEEFGLEYEVVGGEQIILLPEIRLLRAILTLVSTPSRNDALMVVLNYYGIGTRDLRILSDFSQKLRKAQDTTSPVRNSVESYSRALELNLVEAISYIEHAEQLCELGMSAAGAVRIIDIARVVQEVRSHINLNMPELVLKVIDELNLYALAEARSRGSKRLKSALAQFVDLAADFANNNPQLGIGDFCKWIDAVESKERGGSEESDQEISIFELREETEPQPDIVQILTVHAAKGLEWDVVAVPELVAGEFSNVLPSKAKSWHTRTTLFPYPLRSDRKHLPIFSAQEMLNHNPYNAMIVDSSNPAYFRKGITGCVFDDYRNRLLPEYESGETRRLAYVAFTRPKSHLILGSYDFKDLTKVQAGYESNLGRSPEDQSLEKYAVEQSVYLKEMYAFQDQTKQVIFSQSAQNPDAISELPFKNIEDFLKWAQPLVADDGEFAPGTTVTENHEILWPRDVDRSLESRPLNVQINKIDLDAISQSLDETENIIELLIAERNAAGGSLSYEAEHFTASGIVSLMNDAQDFLMDQIRPIPRKPLRAARIGTDVHAQIAEYFSAPSTLDIDSVAYPGEMPIDDDLLADEPRRNELMARFESSRFAKLPHVAIEQPVEISLLSTPIRCVIDAVFDTSHVDSQKPITIVDWKTGKRPSEQHIQSRQFQLELYRLAWSHAYDVPLENIDACFYYLGEEDPQRRELHAQNLNREMIEETIAEKIREGEQLIRQN